MNNHQTQDLETVTEEASKKKTALVDIGGNVTYSIIVGALLDYKAGLNLLGIVTARTTGTGINFVTGSPYGWWREQAFKLTKTKEEKRTLITSLKKNIAEYEGIKSLKEPTQILVRKTRKTLVDLLAFNSFQVPVYGLAVAIGSWVSEGEVNMEKVQNGMEYLMKISPLIGPTMGWYIDGLRKLFGVNTAAEGSYTNKKE